MNHPCLLPPTTGSSFLRLLFLLHLLLFVLPPCFCDEDYSRQIGGCRTISQNPCGDRMINISYPFRYKDDPFYCGYPGLDLSCEENADVTALVVSIGTKKFEVMEIDYTRQSLTVVDLASLDPCFWPFTNITLNTSPFSADTDSNLNITFLNCSSRIPYFLRPPVPKCPDVQDNTLTRYWTDDVRSLPEAAYACQLVQLPMDKRALDWMAHGNISEALQEGFTVDWTAGIWQNCSYCLSSAGVCGYEGNQTCYCPNDKFERDGSCHRRKGSSKKTAIIVGACALAGVSVVAIFLCQFSYRRRKRKQLSSVLLPGSQATSFEPSSKEDEDVVLELEQYPATKLFQYEELHEATDGFSESNELGDGGFGTVYKGTLQDGRTVAIKRLYENNYRRVEQFRTEVHILSSLRHPYLVSLYGCTSRHSRELLLVYEYIPNGTVADHLHGSRASEQGLSWRTRLRIAIETAEALSFLHAVIPQIIHRDVKTNNILLDSDFHVKVADFGLSRLFPVNATHVSTAPQGTPGYVDPEYHQCYQLTDKSDVYSFGVVLAELISSRPAVDLSRPRQEINLAYMALSKIQNDEVDQLVDPKLRQEYSSEEMVSMINSVAEVAFRCLQLERETRPTMREVFETLKGIENEVYNRAAAAAREEKDHVSLLRKNPDSPDTVTAKWESRKTTPNASG